MNIKYIFLLALSILGTGCSDNLNTLDGPASGTVKGFVCKTLPVLSATVEMPVAKAGFVREGQCLNLTASKKVKVLRTVMMPGDGKYSQFEVTIDNTTLKLWISTSSIRES